MHDKLWHKNLKPTLRGTHKNPLCHLLPNGDLRLLRQQMFSILGTYWGHNLSQNSKLSQPPSHKGKRTTGSLKLCTYF